MTTDQPNDRQIVVGGSDYAVRDIVFSTKYALHAKSRPSDEDSYGLTAKFRNHVPSAFEEQSTRTEIVHAFVLSPGAKAARQLACHFPTQHSAIIIDTKAHATIGKGKFLSFMTPGNFRRCLPHQNTNF